VSANAMVGFFLTPVILHHLGDEAFGLWVLITTMVGYYGLFDTCLCGPVIRYVSRHNELGDAEGINQAVTTAFYSYCGVCLLVIASVFLLAPSLPHFFSVQPNLNGPFRRLFLLAGVMQALMLPLAVFAATLRAATRFDQAYMLRVASLVFRVMAVIAVIHLHGGLFAMGAAVVIPNLFLYSAQVPLAFRAIPGMSLHPQWMSKSVLHDMFRYSSVSFTVGVGEKLRDYIYPVIIAKTLSSVAVTFFSLPMKLMAVPLEGIGTMTEIVNPISSKLEGRSDFATLRKLIQFSVQSAFLVLVPIVTFLFIFGKEVLSVWLGAKYASAYPIVLLLVSGMGPAATQCCAQSMLFGIERHRALVWYRLGEGMTIAFVGTACLRLWGLMGLAIVVAVTLFTTSLVLIPRHLCRILEMPLGTYLKEGCLKPWILGIPLAAMLLAAHSVLKIETWPALICALLATVISYLVVVCALGLSGFLSGTRLSMKVLDFLREVVLQRRMFKPMAVKNGFTAI